LSNNQNEVSGLLSRSFVVLCAVYFLNSFLSSPFSALFPVYVEADLARPSWFTGYLKGMMLFLGGIFAISAGRLCDKFGQKFTLILGLLGSSFGGLVFHTSDPSGLTMMLIVMGASSGPWSTAGQSMLIHSVRPAYLGIGSGLYFLSNTLGNAFGSLCTGWLKTTWSFPEIGTVTFGGLLVLTGLAIAFIPPMRLSTNQTTGNNVKGESTWTAYKPLLIRKDIWLLLSLRLTITTFWGMATLAIPLLIYRISNNESLPAYFAAISLVVAAIFQLGIGLISDRAGYKIPLIVSAIGIFISTMGLALFPTSLFGIFVYGTFLTGTAWAVSTLVPKLINEIATSNERNRVVGLGHLAWSISMFSGNLIGGYLIDIYAGLPFVAGCALTTLGTIFSWRLCRHLDNVKSKS
tara:strand:- start:3554 stop:4771 length:1218 start_codon:yes stop_codon:yes gene_type:complete